MLQCYINKITLHQGDDPKKEIFKLKLNKASYRRMIKDQTSGSINKPADDISVFYKLDLTPFKKSKVFKNFIKNAFESELEEPGFRKRVYQFMNQMRIETIKEYKVDKKNKVKKLVPTKSWKDLTNFKFTPSGKFIPDGVVPHNFDRMLVSGVKNFKYWDEIGDFLYKKIINPFSGFRFHLISLSYLGPLRKSPERIYRITGAEEPSVGSQGEHTIQSVYKRKALLVDIINGWFKKFNIPYIIDVVPVMGKDGSPPMISLKLTDSRSGVSITPAEVGFGISQLLPILVEPFVSGVRTVMVEQPEIHLHPRLQSRLGDFFLQTSSLIKNLGSKRKNGFTQKTQWIVETHSEALAYRILQLVRKLQTTKTPIDPSKISFLYVNPKSDGDVVVYRIRINEEGKFIDKWPKGFFDEEFEDMLSIQMS